MPRPNFIQGTVFLLIKSGCNTRRDIAKTLNCTPRAVDKIVERLKRRGCIRSVVLGPSGVGLVAQRYVYEVTQADPPQDLRGVTPESRKNWWTKDAYPDSALVAKKRSKVSNIRREGTSSEIPQIPSLAALLP